MEIHRLTRLLAAVLTMLSVLSTAVAQSPPLTPAQEARLKKFLPSVYPKLLRRQPIVVIVCGDDSSTFAQPAGRPRYDSAMAWHGRFLEELGGRFMYHGGVREPNPHSELKHLQSEAEKEWRAFELEQATGKKKVLPPDPAKFNPADPEPLSLADIMRRSFPLHRQIATDAEFIMENYSRDGAGVMQAFQPLTTEALLDSPQYKPDLVIISYGMQDALAGTSPSAFRAAMDQYIAMCRKSKVDVIIGGPSLTVDTDERIAFGRARQYAAAARDAADAAGVFYADLGALQMHRASDLQSLIPAECFNAVRGWMKLKFQHGEAGEDPWHFNGRSHRELGQAVCAALLDGPPAGSRVQVTAILVNSSGGGAKVEYRLANRSDAECKGVFCPLSLPGWDLAPGQKDFAFGLSPGKVRRVSWNYVRPAHSTTAFHPANRPPAEGVLSGSAVLCDTDVQTLANIPVAIKSVTLEWPEGKFDNASGDLLLACTFVNGLVANGAAVPVSGKAVVQWRGAALPPVDVVLPPGERVPFPIRIPLPAGPGDMRFRDTVTVSLPLPDGQVLKFERSIDAIRQPGLDQKIPLASFEDIASGRTSSQPAPVLTFSADVNNLWVVCDIAPGLSGDKVAALPAAKLEVQIDGRDAKTNGTLGYVDRIVAEYPWSDGAPRFQKLRPGLFGNGYNYDFDPRVLVSSITTKPDGSRRISLTIPRLWLPQHEWSLNGSGQAAAGVNVVLSLADASQGGNFSLQRAWALNMSGFMMGDARGLALLELTSKPSGRWSVRVH